MSNDTNKTDILTDVAAVLHSRKSAEPDSSYVASLYFKGLDAILKKVGEEATEVVMAAKDVEADTSETKDKTKIVNEVTDLWFHTLVLLAHENLHPDDVLKELDRRLGTSGIVEKASRK
ncbi:MAG: phosphoribosyl-ATP pyrophosphohydrolase [Cocleimonas sp.]|jgi:phosphoribosyl-ATP pyrophosphohydrolase